MVDAKDISWAEYKSWEGPIWLGKNTPFKLSPAPTEEEKILAVITATESNSYSAFNGYDRCGWSVGLLQFCEASFYLVSDLLGAVADVDEGLIRSVHDYARTVNTFFAPNLRRRYRFHYRDARGEVDRLQEQQQLFYLTGDGTKGSWTNAGREYAKGWAAAISTVWESEEAQWVQLQYVVDRLRSFALPQAKLVIDGAPGTAIGRAFIAAYLSFAVNNPTLANKHLQLAMATTRAPVWSLAWLVAVLKEMTFGPNITIYPHRYRAIRGPLERLYGIDLPDMDAELLRWQDTHGIEWLPDAVELQMGLLALGFDLGPKGADGVIGPKTKDAILTFERLNGVPNPDGMPDLVMVQHLEQALEARGREELA